MRDEEKSLIRYVCFGNLEKARTQAKIILENSGTKKDESFCKEMLCRLDAQSRFIELPSNIKGMLVVEDTENFHEGKYLPREQEINVADKVLATYKAADKLAQIGLHYVPAIILHGESGCGKTELARYIAYRAGLPFAYVRFSALVSSLLGNTRANLSRIFDYVREAPCVLCFDELDAIGLARGQSSDVGEMSRIVIALMQELDRCPNNIILVGTTNRFDRLDPALVRRFSLQYEVQSLPPAEAAELAQRIFRYSELETEICFAAYSETVPASAVVKDCIEAIVSYVAKQAGP